MRTGLKDRGSFEAAWFCLCFRVCVCVSAVESVRRNKCIWQDRWLHCVSSHIFNSQVFMCLRQEREMGVSEDGEKRQEKSCLCKPHIYVWWIDRRMNVCPHDFSICSYCDKPQKIMFFLTMRKNRKRVRRTDGDKDKGFTSTFLHGCFYESAFHSKKYPLTRPLHHYESLMSWLLHHCEPFR